MQFLRIHKKFIKFIIAAVVFNCKASLYIRLGICDKYMLVACIGVCVCECVSMCVCVCCVCVRVHVCIIIYIYIL